MLERFRGFMTNRYINPPYLTLCNSTYHAVSTAGALGSCLWNVRHLFQGILIITLLLGKIQDLLYFYNNAFRCPKIICDLLLSAHFIADLLFYVPLYKNCGICFFICCQIAVVVVVFFCK